MWSKHNDCKIHVYWAYIWLTKYKDHEDIYSRRYELLPGQCRVQRQDQQWLCPPSHHCDETPSHPSLPAATSYKPGLTQSLSRSDSPSAAGSCKPSCQWPPVLSLDWWPSDHLCNRKLRLLWHHVRNLIRPIDAYLLTPDHQWQSSSFQDLDIRSSCLILSLEGECMT